MDLIKMLHKSLRFSSTSGSMNGRAGLERKWSLNASSPMPNSTFPFGRPSSLDPTSRSLSSEALSVPKDLDATMQLLFLACKGDVDGIEELLKGGVDVNSADFDGRSSLHIAACEGHVDVVQILLNWGVNIDAKDRWGSTAAADARHYGNEEVYKLLIANGAKALKSNKTPMAVSNPKEVPEYELKLSELCFRQGDLLLKGTRQVGWWNGTKVSVKILDDDVYSDPETLNAFKTELALRLKVRHPNVVQFFGAVTQDLPMMIISEYHPRGDLGSYIKKKGPLQISKVLKLALEIARGMNYLHECKPDPIIHCNLTPKNILLGDDGELKVANFGLIMMHKLSHGKYKLAHSAPDNYCLYMAPELYKNEVFDRSADSFAFGFIIYEMIEGVPAFHPKAPEEFARKICLEGVRPKLTNKSKSHPHLNKLIEECWSSEPLARPSFEQIIDRLNLMIVNVPKQRQVLKENPVPKQSHWSNKLKFPRT